jgi:ribosomal-protein-alanine N-acetyltransferase
MSAVLSDAAPGVRYMLAADLATVLQIEKRAYEFPWSEGIFRDCLNAGHVMRVLELQSVPVGYSVMSVGAGECHLLNLCVDPPHQGQGLGRFLLETMLAIARRHRARIAFLEMRISNRRAFRLYHDIGFNEIGTRRNYYPAAAGEREDAWVLAKVLS